MRPTTTRTLLLGAAIGVASLGFGNANAATSVGWTSPADGSSYPVGTSVAPSGNASGSGTTGGNGLDLAIVMDSSGSMGSYETIDGTTQSRGDWQKDFAQSLVGQLPTASTSVSIVEFDSYANTVQTLTSLTPASNVTAINSAIDSVNESGGTHIGNGIDEARSELVTNGTDGRSRQMVVFSDGASSGYPATNADQAKSADGISVHAVGLPGHSQYQMQDIADGADNTVGTDDDNGTYTDGNNLQTLLDIFSGTGGNLVGLSQLDITLPDGTVVSDVATDALGNFDSPAYNLDLGPNVFKAQAWGTDGTTAEDTITLYGTGGTADVPEPGALGLLLAGLLGGGLVGRRRLRR